MTAKPTFKWFTAEELIAAAGGDPWAIADQLHAGDAGAINDLAGAFHRAGNHVKDADEQFRKAQEQFKNAYNRNNGSEHPINDAAEVQRLNAQLAGHPEQLSNIAVNLEQTAAALATAQRDATTEVGELNAALHSIDADLSAAGPQLPLVLEQLLDEARAQTTMSLGTLEKIQGTYVVQLRAAQTAMQHSGYAANAIDAADGAQLGNADAAGTLTDLQHSMDQAVLDQMAKVRQIQKEIDDTAAIAYTNGPGSGEGQDARARLPGLKQKLVDELNTLGNLPDYSNLDPAALSSTADGKFLLDYNVDGVAVQASGQLRNGTGEIFDQAKQSYFTFKDGKLVSVRALDPGRVTPDDELLFNAVTLAVGAPELAVGVKAAGEGAFHGIKSLLGGEAAAALRSGGENLLTKSMAAAQARAEAAGYRLTDDLAPRPLTTADSLPAPPVTTRAADDAVDGIPAGHHGPHTHAPSDNSPSPVIDVSPEHARELGMDPATGSYRPAESDTGLRIEQELGAHLSRATENDAYDWIDATGRTYDAVGNFPSKYFDTQWPNLQSRIVDHLNKADVVPVDVSQFTAPQRQVVREFIHGLNNPNVMIIGDT
jgi:hypothetical protein